MDIDDTMTTSTNSSGEPNPDFQDMDDENDELFPDGSNPASARPQTPANDHLNATAPGELSPPRSQHQQAPAAATAVANGGGGGGGGGVGSSSYGNPCAFDEDEPPTEQAREDKPGASWKNKKAQEEMQRAWDNIVDRDFSLKEFGDVMMQSK